MIVIHDLAEFFLYLNNEWLWNKVLTKKSTGKLQAGGAFYVRIDVPESEVGVILVFMLFSSFSRRD